MGMNVVDDVHSEERWRSSSSMGRSSAASLIRIVLSIAAILAVLLLDGQGTEIRRRLVNGKRGLSRGKSPSSSSLFAHSRTGAASLPLHHRPFTRHAILVSGMATKDAITCWPLLKRTFVDDDGRPQDAYVVLGLNRNGTREPTQSEQEVLDFFKADPDVRVLHVDRHPYLAPPQGRLATLIPDYPWWHKVMQNKTPELEKREPPTTTLSLWRTFLAWELMQNTSQRHGNYAYDMVVRVRPDVFLPEYAYDGWRRKVNLDAFGRGRGDPHLHDLECESIFYDSWDTDNVVLPRNQLAYHQYVPTNGQSVLGQEVLGPGREIRAQIFFSYFSVYAGGFSDYFAWGKREDMRLYHETVFSLNEIMMKSKIMLAPEAIKKYSILMALRRMEKADGVSGRTTYVLEVSPCSRVVYCLTTWYYPNPPNPEACSYDNPFFRWPALIDQG